MIPARIRGKRKGLLKGPKKKEKDKGIFCSRSGGKNRDRRMIHHDKEKHIGFLTRQKRMADHFRQDGGKETIQKQKRRNTTLLGPVMWRPDGEEKRRGNRGKKGWNAHLGGRRGFFISVGRRRIITPNIRERVEKMEGVISPWKERGYTLNS